MPYRPVRTWQIWNEPGMRVPVVAAGRLAAEVRRAAATAYPAVKQADPGAKVVLGGLANASWEEIDALYDQGGIKGNFDVVAIHYYARIPAQFIEVAHAACALRSHTATGGMPIWWTEAGASASKGKIDAPANKHFQTTDKGMADVAHQDLQGCPSATAASSGSSASTGTRGRPRTSSAGRVRLLRPERVRRRTVKPRPALAAYRKVARSYEGCRKDARARCVR